MASPAISGLQQIAQTYSFWVMFSSRFLDNGSTDSEKFTVVETVIQVLHFLLCNLLDIFPQNMKTKYSDIQFDNWPFARNGPIDRELPIMDCEQKKWWDQIMEYANAIRIVKIAFLSTNFYIGHKIAFSLHPSALVWQIASLKLQAIQHTCSYKVDIWGGSKRRSNDWLCLKIES